MILKIDHLAFCSPHLDEDLRTFGILGYEALFVEKDLRDLENKQPFMKHFSGHLDMALMTRRGSISIELLNHGHVVAEDSYVLPVFEGALFDVERSEDSSVVHGCSFVKARSDLLKAEFFILEGVRATEFVCNKVIVDADNIERASDFWCSLGFKPAAAGEPVTHLEFRSPFMEGTYQLYIRKRESPLNQFVLDSQGFNCIAFISTDAEKERRRFDQLGMEPTEPYPFRVNGKDLCIFWVRGPSGEIVEVISLG